MPRYCSQCGVAGHNKRNLICRININNRKYQLITQQIEGYEFPYLKLELLDSTILALEYQFNSSKRNHATSQRTMEYYYRLFLESKGRWIHCQQYRTMEEVNAAYDEMMCAEASYKIMRQYFVSDTLLKNDLQKLLQRFIQMEQAILRTHVKHTSDYLKEMTLLVHDLTIVEGTNCECPLCYDTLSITDALHTNCSHSYCVECVKNLATSIKDKTTEPTCPCCRTTIKEIKTGNPEILLDFRAHLLRL